MTPSFPPPHAIVLAAGEGKRMASILPKVAHMLAGQTFLHRALQALVGIPVANIVVVTNPRHAVVHTLVEEFQAKFPNIPVHRAEQDPPRGTGDAVRCALPALGDLPPEATILVAYGDTPNVPTSLFQLLLQQHTVQNCAITLLAFTPPSPTGYGRVILNNTEFVCIREEKDASEEEKKVTLCSSGILCVRWDVLNLCLPLLNTQNAAGEYYLTDLPKIAQEHLNHPPKTPAGAGWAEKFDKIVGVFAYKGDPAHLLGINTPLERETLEKKLSEIL